MPGRRTRACLPRRCSLGDRRPEFRAEQITPAILQYQEPLRLTPNLVLAHAGLGFLYADRGKLDLAITHYQEAARLAPDRPIIIHALATLLDQTGRLADAFEQW